MSNGNKQILWVDDEIEYLRAHIMFLEEHNYDVFKATNGDDALEIIKEKKFDLIFLDEQMPGKDGLTTLEEIKVIDQNIPVVMVTKSEEEQLMEEAIGRNISSYLTKPVNPSQILSICKNLLHSRAIKHTRITSEYVNEYAEYKARFMTRQVFQDWASLYMSLCRWDINFPTIQDQGLEETHKNHKLETSRKFVRFIEQQYTQWHSGRINSPFLVTNSFKKTVAPLLKENKKVCMLTMTGFRLDQWLTIKGFLQKMFDIKEDIACTLLPSKPLYCRTALFSGKSSLNISLDHPRLWEKLTTEENPPIYEKELLKLNLFSNGITDIDNPVIRYFNSREDSDNFLSEINSLKNESLITLVVAFSELLMAMRQQDSLLMEIAPDERGLREITRIWFESSNLFRIIRNFASQNRTIVLTSDHGSILAINPVEVFCQEERTPNPRVKHGKDISCDERYVYFVESPEQFGLPKGEPGEGFAIAKENYYFIYPNKYQYFGTKFKGQMVSGGISMEEMLVPLVTLHPNVG